jgi:hypothetical protein
MSSYSATLPPLAPLPRHSSAISLMLDRALRTGRVLALRRSEARVVTELLARSTDELRELRQEILDRLANER